MAEGARLESVFTRKGNEGSNPSLSANLIILRRHTSLDPFSDCLDLASVSFSENAGGGMARLATFW